MSDIRLPPVDDYRQPLIVPLGYMVLLAAWFENRMYQFITTLVPGTTTEQVAHELRFWSRTYLDETVKKAITDPELLADVMAFFDRVDVVRKRQHRLVHDAIEVGVFPVGKIGDDQGWRTELLREEYERLGKQSELKLTPVTPEDVAAVSDSRLTPASAGWCRSEHVDVFIPGRRCWYE